MSLIVLTIPRLCKAVIRQVDILHKSQVKTLTSFLRQHPFSADEGMAEMKRESFIF